MQPNKKLGLLLCCLAFTAVFSTASISTNYSSLYVPVGSPCKIGDTRQTGTPNIENQAYVEWVAYGDDLSGQGGESCSNPKGTINPIAMSVTINAVATKGTGSGNLSVYPADGSPGTAAVIYSQGSNIGNSTTVALCNDGFCDGKFRIMSRGADVPVSAIVNGYFYAEASNSTTVAISGGDYPTISAAMNDLASWCGTPGFFNLCTVNVAAGLFIETDIFLKSYVSIVGTGVNATKVGTSSEGPVFTIDGVEDAQLSRLSIINLGSFTGSVNSPVGIVIDTTNGDNDVQIRDVSLAVDGGLSETTGIVIGDFGGAGNNVFFDNVDINIPNGASQIAIQVASASRVRINRVRAAAQGGTGLSLVGANMLFPITFSQFYGSTNDIDASAGGTTATITHTHLSSGNFDFTGSSISCHFVSTASEELQSPTCASPP